MHYIIGTSGFFYRDWKGIFYPEDLKPNQWLEYFSKYFNGLEINSSFYHFPNKNTIKIFKKYDLNYIFKVNRIFTHFKKYNIDQVQQFVKVLDILEEKFKGLIFQFSPTFVFKQENIDYLEKLISDFFSFFDKSCFVEFRSNDWFENKDLLKDLASKFNGKLSIVHTDGKFRGKLIYGPWENINLEIEYFRFHGRGESTYNYLYSDEELKEFARKIKNLSKGKEEIYVFFNNTVRAQAVQNALKMKNILYQLRLYKDDFRNKYRNYPKGTNCRYYR